MSPSDDFPTHIYTINGPGTTSLCEFYLDLLGLWSEWIGLVGREVHNHLCQLIF
jgi:hypothetical protein